MVYRIWIFNILTLALLGGCASSNHIAKEYGELRYTPAQSQTNRTTIFFLIDGLPLQLVRDELKSGRIPSIRNFFIAKTNTFFVAHTTFPSLTYPAITSLLAERPVDQHGVFGNLIVEQGGEPLSFESPKHFSQLNNMIVGKTIFSRMSNKGLATASLDRAFRADSSVYLPVGDVKLGYAVLDKNYSYVDNITINSLENLLTNTEPSLWPTFIFVHLIGVDLTSHDSGPNSTAVSDYFNFLDKKLARVFSTIDKIEQQKKREVVALMSSDHGFDISVSKYLNLEKAIHEYDSRIRILNEGRFASIYFPGDWSSAKKEAFMNSWSIHPAIDIVAYRENEKVFITSGPNKNTLLYSSGQCNGSNFSISILPSSISKCPESLNDSENNLYYPFFVSNLSHYFQSNSHPDAVIISKPGVAFSNEYKGQHGGPTQQEVFVPLLMHNATLTDTKRSPALWDLLRFL